MNWNRYDGSSSSGGGGSQQSVKIKVCHGSSLDEVTVPSASTFGSSIPSATYYMSRIEYFWTSRRSMNWTGYDGTGSSGGGSSQHRIKIKVFRGSSLDEVIVPSESTFGDVKEIIANQTGIDPAQQRLFFRGREKDDSETLHMAGVKDQSKLLLVEQSASEEQKEEIRKACQAIAQVRGEVDKLCEEVGNVETVVTNGVKLDEKEFMVLTELLMRQLLKLDGIVADGEARAQRKNEVKRIQGYVDKLDVLKTTNAHLS